MDIDVAIAARFQDPRVFVLIQCAVAVEVAAARERLRVTNRNGQIVILQICDGLDGIAEMSAEQGESGQHVFVLCESKRCVGGFGPKLRKVGVECLEGGAVQCVTRVARYGGQHRGLPTVPETVHVEVHCLPQQADLGEEGSALCVDLAEADADIAAAARAAAAAVRSGLGVQRRRREGSEILGTGDECAILAAVADAVEIGVAQPSKVLL